MRLKEEKNRETSFSHNLFSPPIHTQTAEGKSVTVTVGKDSQVVVMHPDAVRLLLTDEAFKIIQEMGKPLETLNLSSFINFFGKNQNKKFK